MHGKNDYAHATNFIHSYQYTECSFVVWFILYNKYMSSLSHTHIGPSSEKRLLSRWYLYTNCNCIHSGWLREFVCLCLCDCWSGHHTWMNNYIINIIHILTRRVRFSGGLSVLYLVALECDSIYVCVVWFFWVCFSFVICFFLFQYVCATVAFGVYYVCVCVLLWIIV